GFPIQFRIGGNVCVVVADRTVDLAQQGNSADLIELAPQAINHVGQFLAHGGGGGGLAMGAGQHGLGGKLVGQIFQAADDGFDLGQQNLIPSLFEHQGVGQVVDILRGAGKVHELGYL